MPKLDPNLYGSDSVSFANGVASDALNQVPIDAEGQAIKQSAQSKSAKDTLRLAEVQTVKAKTVGGGRDSRATTEGQHGEQG